MLKGHTLSVIKARINMSYTIWRPLIWGIQRDLIHILHSFWDRNYRSNENSPTHGSRQYHPYATLKIYWLILLLWPQPHGSVHLGKFLYFSFSPKRNGNMVCYINCLDKSWTYNTIPKMLNDMVTCNFRPAIYSRRSKIQFLSKNSNVVVIPSQRPLPCVP